MSAAFDSTPPGELYCPACEQTFHAGDRCPSDGARLIRLKARVDPFVGRNLDDRYTVLEKLGQGGMGAVYRAQQHSVGREVAIKVVNAALVSDADVIKRFLREAKLASKLAHPNAVAVLDFNQTDDGVFYLVMELVSGRTLDQVLKAERVLPPERVVRIGTQILDALDGAHALSIIHRDLKPANVMLLAQGRDLVKVLDFGLAKSVSPDEASVTMTGAGSLVGTPAFMPPELATGAPCDGRADLYSLGCILYLMGSGRLPFVSESIHELLALHGSDEPAPPMTGVPPRLAAVIDTLLQKDPARRYQTAAAALHALEASLHASSAGLDRPSVTSVGRGRRAATGDDFEHLETPPAPSVIEARTATTTTGTRPRPTEVARIAAGETLLAGTAEAVPARSITTDTAGAPAPRRARWAVVVAGLAVVAVAAITATLMLGAGDAPSTAPTDTPTERIPAAPSSPPVAAPTTGTPSTGSAGASSASAGSATAATTPSNAEGTEQPPPAAATGTAAPPADPATSPGKPNTRRPVKPTSGRTVRPRTTRPVEPSSTRPPPTSPTTPSSPGAGSGKPAPLPF